MFVLRATRNLLGRLGPVDEPPVPASTTRLGDWYATAWTGRPLIALLVSEAALLPVLMPLAPAATLPKRFPDHLAQALRDHEVPTGFIDEELARMQDVRLATTASRSVLGIMNEFTFLAQEAGTRPTLAELPELARWLARTPCSPLYRRHVSPDRELHALVATHQS